MLGLTCIDVDGTLVGSSNEVLPAVWDAAELAVAAGMHLCLSTGRPAFGKARAYAERLDPQGWHIFQNGASIVNLESGESLSEPLPQESLLELIEKSRRLGRILEVYTDSEYTVDSDQPLAVEHAALLGVPYVRRDPLSLKGQVVRVQWVVPIEQTGEVLAEAHDGLSLHPAGSPAMPDTMFISVTRAGVGKASAVQSVASRYGLPLADVMMVGDGENDVGVMREVGHPVAMGNAVPAALAAARYTVGSVDEAGLAEALRLALRLERTGVTLSG
ncbi:Cof-type HAD-IIB family hydrolase [Deinococcus sp.]|uniref:Cof-type HAD-IIB family hydrolase n=1 Tax=Deinococcus sp. TaxID=47478 RepID=UPI003CC5A187